MSSQIGLIIEQIAVEIVANSDVDAAYDGHKSKNPSEPYAEVYMDEFGDNQQEIQGTFDMPARVAVFVVGAQVESTREMTETLAKYFTNGPSETLQGSTMNVINIQVRSWEIEPQRDDTKGAFTSSIEFNILIRYTI